MKLRKFLAVLLAAAISVAALSFTALADYTVEINSGDVQEALIDKSEAKVLSNDKTVDGDNKGTQFTWFKIKATKAGTLKLWFSSMSPYADLYVCNGYGEKLKYYNSTVEDGSVQEYDKSDTTHIWMVGDENGKFSGTFFFKLPEKGTYYILLVPGWAKLENCSEYSIKASFPADKSSAKINCITVPLAKGSSIQLEADITDDDAKVTWSSSNKAVAAVSSSGKVTAKEKGTAIITAKCGKSKQKIRINVI